MKILITTGIYPPEIGGPAEYAKNLAEVWYNEGKEVEVGVFSKWNYLPTGIRHLAYFLSLVGPVLRSDLIVVLDTFSAALPSVIASKILRKKIILRTGGDFLWESYVERTGDLVLLRDFYKTRINNFSLKERITFNLIKFVLKNVDAVIWSTEFQKNIFLEPYDLKLQNHFIVENYFGSVNKSNQYKNKNFVASTRPIKWKNIKTLKEVFERREVVDLGAILDMEPMPHDGFLDKISKSFAVVVASLGDISPNTIIDSISCGKPFIVTRETGLYERIKDVAVFVDPQNPDDIAEKVVWLCNDDNYKNQKEKVESFMFTHTWEEIAKEYLEVYNKIK